MVNLIMGFANLICNSSTADQCHTATALLAVHVGNIARCNTSWNADLRGFMQRASKLLKNTRICCSQALLGLSIHVHDDRQAGFRVHLVDLNVI